MSSSKFFNRTYTLTISSDSINLSVSKLQIIFDIDLSINAIAGSGNFTIIGLSKEHRAVLEKLSILSTGEVISKDIKLTLDAGHGSNKSNIFTGTVISSSISGPPELAVSLKAITLNAMNLKRKNVETEAGTKLEDVATAVFAGFGLNFVNKSGVGKQEIDSKSFDGNCIDCIRQMCTMDAWNLIVSSGDVVAKPIDPRESKYNISEANGLLGVDNITNFSANMLMWLQPFENFVGDAVTLQSVLHPSANGLWVVNRVHYKGDYRGKSWYVYLYGRRAG